MQHALVTTPDGIALPEFFFKDGQFLIIRLGKAAEPIEARPRSYSPSVMCDTGRGVGAAVS